MSWVLIAVVAWLVLGASIGLLIGMSIHHADVRAVSDEQSEPNVAIDESPLGALRPVAEGGRAATPVPRSAVHPARRPSAR